MTKKLLLTLLLMLGCIGIYFFKNVARKRRATEKLNPIRRMLCYLRGGDYVHPGDEVAIDLTIEKALQFDPTLKSKPLLDVGCGFGGTLHYLAKKGFKKAEGIDIDEAGIEYATLMYPRQTFSVANILEENPSIQKHSISFFTLFSVAYSIENKKKMLEAIGKLAAPNAIIAIWDYAIPLSATHAKVTDAANKSMHPIIPGEFHETLYECGWNLLFEEDQADYFSEGYRITLQKLSEQKLELEKLFSPKTVVQTQLIYEAIKNNIESGKLGGTLIIARKNS